MKRYKDPTWLIGAFIWGIFIAMFVTMITAATLGHYGECAKDAPKCEYPDVAVCWCSEVTDGECRWYCTTDPCEWEEHQAEAICRALGAKSADCKEAIADYELCKVENSDSDPIGGADD